MLIDYSSTHLRLWTLWLCLNFRRFSFNRGSILSLSRSLKTFFLCTGHCCLPSLQIRHLSAGVGGQSLTMCPYFRRGIISQTGVWGLKILNVTIVFIIKSQTPRSKQIPTSNVQLLTNGGYKNLFTETQYFELFF